MLFSIKCYKSLVKDILYSNTPAKKLSACGDHFKKQNTVNKCNTFPLIVIIDNDLLVSFCKFY